MSDQPAQKPSTMRLLTWWKRREQLMLLFLSLAKLLATQSVSLTDKVMKFRLLRGMVRWTNPLTVPGSGYQTRVPQQRPESHDTHSTAIQNQSWENQSWLTASWGTLIFSLFIQRCYCISLKVRPYWTPKWWARWYTITEGSICLLFQLSDLE